MVEKSVEIAPLFCTSALRFPRFVVFISFCKYQFDFYNVESDLAAEIGILLSGWSEETSW